MLEIGFKASFKPCNALSLVGGIHTPKLKDIKLTDI